MRPSFLSRSFLVIGSRREVAGEDKDEAASGAEVHILRTTSFRSLLPPPPPPALAPPSPSSLSFVPVVVVDSTGKVNITATLLHG